MNNKKNIVIVLSIMVFALTTAICVQIRSVEKLNVKASQNYTEKNLKAEVLQYKEKYDNKLKDIERIDEELNRKLEKASENNSELQKAKEKIEKGNKIIGLSEVKGPGVIITLSDSKMESNIMLNSSDLLVHDKDILNVVNELKNAGAEAISINDQRLLSTTAIICGGNIISINGEKIGAPFTIKAIGFPETLANLARPGGHLSSFKERKLDVDIKKTNDITIPKYSGVLNYKYVKTSK